MRENHELHLIWLKELGLAVVAPRHVREERFAAAAVIVKGDDGADHFIPYDGYVAGAPLAFSLTRVDQCRISVLAFGHEREVVEIAAWRLNEDLSLHNPQPEPGAVSDTLESGPRIGVTVTGFGERTTTTFTDASDDRGNPVGRDVAVGADEQTQLPPADEADDVGAVSIGLTMLDYEIDGEVDYSDLLSSFLVDLRQVEDERFTAFYVTAVPTCLPLAAKGGPGGAAGGLEGDEDALEIGPAVHLRPLHHYQYSLQTDAVDKPFDELALEADDPFNLEAEEGKRHPMAGAALISRHGGFAVRHVPLLTLYAGTSREQVDFALRNGFHLHWRRQLEGAVRTRQERREKSSFIMEEFSERHSLIQHQGAYYFRWSWPEAVIGDVVGVKFASDSAIVELSIDESHQAGADETKPLTIHGGEALFLFLGERFEPLTKELLSLAENQTLASKLHGLIDQRAGTRVEAPYLKNARAQAAMALFQRDAAFESQIEANEINGIIGSGPYGFELMVYRDHVLRTKAAVEMQGWLGEIKSLAQSGRRARLIATLQYERFLKAPALAHALVFNPFFRERFKTKPLDPHSSNMPVLEYLMSQNYSDAVIDWAMRLKGESQAILWQLCLKRPQMVEHLYDLKLEPDLALNPFDDKSLDMAEAALNDSSGIDADVIEKKVIPIFQSLGEERQVEEMRDFARALAFGAEGKALSLGELSVCLAAVEQAESQWEKWRRETGEIFHVFLNPLEIEFPDFKAGDDYSLSDRLEAQHGVINNLIERLARELQVDEEVLSAALAFIKSFKIGSVLDEIEGKLDLALKYHHDLEIGADKLFNRFNSSPEELAQLMKINRESWPDISRFPPVFQAPLAARRSELKESFEVELSGFAASVHPRDELFLSTFRTAMGELKAGLDLLVLLETGKELEMRRERIQKRLHQAILPISPISAKLRQSTSLPRAVRDLVIAERQGPAGWPQLSLCLDKLEQDLKRAES